MDLQMPQEIRAFLESLMREAGTTPADTLQAEQLLRELFLQLDSQIIDTVVDHLPTEVLDDFMVFVSRQPTRQQLEAYLQTHLPNAHEVFVLAFRTFRDAYLKTVTDKQR